MCFEKRLFWVLSRGTNFTRNQCCEETNYDGPGLYRGKGRQNGGKWARNTDSSVNIKTTGFANGLFS
jgi:hypothetical protein